eukprot:CFRG2273T1
MAKESCQPNGEVGARDKLVRSPKQSSRLTTTQNSPRSSKSSPILAASTEVPTQINDFDHKKKGRMDHIEHNTICTDDMDDFDGMMSTTDSFGIIHDSQLPSVTRSPITSRCTSKNNKGSAVTDIMRASSNVAPLSMNEANTSNSNVTRSVPMDQCTEISSSPLALPVWACEFLAEMLGTAFLVFFGTGSVSAAAIGGAQSGLWQVAVVWGWCVTIAIYCVGHVSGAHLNPSISFAFALWDNENFGWKRCGYYMIAQFLGAFIGSCLMWSIFSGMIEDYESTQNIVRGAIGSERTAMVFGEYFPNPAMYPEQNNVVSTLQAFWAEVLGTAFLAFVIFATTAPCNNGIPAQFAPLFIGFTVAIIISLVAPVTQAGLNPARDFSPRLLAVMLGWGKVAIPGPRNGFWIYILAPMLGAPIGSGIAKFGIQRPCKRTEPCFTYISSDLDGGSTHESSN